MNATKERALTRTEKIDRWVELAALDLVAAGGWDWPTDDLFTAFDIGDVAYERGDKLAGELWPDAAGERSMESEEYQDAYERVLLLAAQLFDRYAEFSAHEAGHCRGLVYARDAIWTRDGAGG
jgi:hypothetical protein